MNESITLRDATTSDIQNLYELIVALAIEEKKDPATLPVTQENLAKYGFSDNPYFHVKVAEKTNFGLIGYALYFYTFRAGEGKPILYLEDLYVKPDFRQQGIATRLMSDLAGRCIEKGCAYMEWCVFNWNEPAIRFYKNMGVEFRQDLYPVRLKATALHALSDIDKTHI